MNAVRRNGKTIALSAAAVGVVALVAAGIEVKNRIPRGMLEAPWICESDRHG